MRTLLVLIICVMAIAEPVKEIITNADSASDICDNKDKLYRLHVVDAIMHDHNPNCTYSIWLASDMTTVVTKDQHPSPSKANYTCYNSITIPFLRINDTISGKVYEWCEGKLIREIWFPITYNFKLREEFYIHNQIMSPRVMLNMRCIGVDWANNTVCSFAYKPFMILPLLLFIVVLIL